MKPATAGRLYQHSLIFKTDPPFAAKVAVLRVCSHLKTEDETYAAVVAGVSEWIAEADEGKALVRDLRWQTPAIADLLESRAFECPTLIPFLKKRDIVVHEVIEARSTHFYDWRKSMVNADTMELIHSGAILYAPTGAEIAP